ncbi:hypothetical protein [Clostridium estertheticum]|uniref:hypothetical protein n=1 Tax=Clostridium estertheticum TaxID=238834 RepID=UPI001CF2A0B7|nr:hypothetical protein [Clostridium estertheticum]MCB2355557.1 hypothetical protein [Clostridium estertheticum]WAG39318.1 hypothetical protein LL065_13475 [Clostridium estertheticum]
MTILVLSAVLAHPVTIGSSQVSLGKYKLALVPTIGIEYITFPVGGAYGNHEALSLF